MSNCIDPAESFLGEEVKEENLISMHMHVATIALRKDSKNNLRQMRPSPPPSPPCMTYTVSACHSKALYTCLPSVESKQCFFAYFCREVVNSKRCS